jgi:hypothetical protein
MSDELRTRNLATALLGTNRSGLETGINMS